MALISPISDESTDNVLAPKRGRPAKNAAVYSENGSVLVTEEQRDMLNELVSGISKDGEKIQKLLLSAAQKYFAIGKIFYQVTLKADSHTFTSAVWFEEKCGVPARVGRTAKKIYDRFADNPEALETMTMREVTMLISEKPEKSAGEVTSPVKYALPVNGCGISEEDFGLPTLSGVQLNQYRFRADSHDGKLYLLSKKYGSAIPVCSLTPEQPRTPDMQTAYNALLEKTQMALEEYYSLIEESEDVGN